MLSQRFLTCSTYSAVSKLQKKLALQRQCDPHHLKLGKAPSMLRCACKDKRKMHRYVRSLRPPPGPSQQRRPCPTPCDQLRILTRDGQATSDHAYTRIHVDSLSVQTLARLGFSSVTKEEPKQVRFVSLALFRGAPCGKRGARPSRSTAGSTPDATGNTTIS